MLFTRKLDEILKHKEYSKILLVLLFTVIVGGIYNFDSFANLFIFELQESCFKAIIHLFANFFTVAAIIFCLCLPFFFSTKLLKFWISLQFILSSILMYVVHSKNIYLDYVVMRELLLLDLHDIFSVLNLKMLAYILCFGFLPSYIICKINIKKDHKTIFNFKELALAAFMSTIAICLPLLLDFQYLQSFFTGRYKAFMPINYVAAFYSVLNNNLSNDVLENKAYNSDVENIEWINGGNKDFLNIVLVFERGSYNGNEESNLQSQKNLFQFHKIYNSSRFFLENLKNAITYEDEISIGSLLKTANFKTAWYSTDSFKRALCQGMDVCQTRLNSSMIYSVDDNKNSNALPWEMQKVDDNEVLLYFLNKNLNENQENSNFIVLQTHKKDELVPNLSNELIRSVIESTYDKNIMVISFSSEGDYLSPNDVDVNFNRDDIIDVNHKNAEMQIWVSDLFLKLHPNFNVRQVLKNQNKKISTSSIFNSILDCIGAESEYVSIEESVCYYK